MPTQTDSCGPERLWVWHACFRYCMLIIWPEFLMVMYGRSIICYDCTGYFAISTYAANGQDWKDCHTVTTIIFFLEQLTKRFLPLTLHQSGKIIKPHNHLKSRTINFYHHYYIGRKKLVNCLKMVAIDHFMLNLYVQLIPHPKF